jgi:hypothetical protein
MLSLTRSLFSQAAVWRDGLRVWMSKETEEDETKEDIDALVKSVAASSLSLSLSLSLSVLSLLSTWKLITLCPTPPHPTHPTHPLTNLSFPFNRMNMSLKLLNLHGITLDPRMPKVPPLVQDYNFFYSHDDDTNV